MALHTMSESRKEILSKSMLVGVYVFLGSTKMEQREAQLQEWEQREIFQ